MVTLRGIAGGTVFVPEDAGRPEWQARSAFLPGTPMPGRATLSLPESWAAGGDYVFWPVAASPQDFAERAVVVANRLGPADPPWRRFAWCDADRVVTVHMRGDADGRVPDAIQFPLGSTSHQLAFGSGVTVALVDDGFTLSGQPYELTVVDPDGGVQSVAGLETPQLRMSGDGGGCLGVTLAPTLEQVEAMGLALRYYRPPAAPSRLPRPIDTTAFPLLRTSGRTLVLGGQADLLAVYDGGRTHFTFAAPVTLPSHFMTAHGHDVDLRPLPESRLVFARQAVTFRQGVTRWRPSLLPSGPFALSVPASEGRHRLQTGLSAAEFVEVRSGPDAAADRIVFHPGKNAFVGPAPAAAAPVELPTTAWVGFETAGGTPLRISTQAEDFSLYAGSQAVDAAPALTALDFAEHLVPPGGYIFPMVPLLGVPSGKAEAAAELETRTLSVWRRDTLSAPPAAPLAAAAADEPEWTKTPQGFLVARAGHMWQAIRFATGDGKASFDLGFDDKTQALADLFQRNRFFVVATRLHDHGTPLARLTGRVTVRGWTFRIDLPNQLAAGAAPADDGTILIVKYHSSSLRDLAADPQRWLGKEMLNGDYQRVFDRLRDLIETTDRRHAVLGAESPFEGFRRRLDDAAWNGVLMLGPGIEGDTLPLQVKGLLGGMDPEKLRAHHLGLDLTRLVPGADAIGESAWFGLIEYPAGGDPPPDRWPADETHTFDVTRLLLLIENSEIRRFVCTASLGLARMFEEATGPRKRIVLDGRYESKLDGNGRPVDSYTFTSELEHTFTLPGPAIDTVTIRKVQFTTVSQDAREVRSRFGLWGSVSFKKIGGALDILPFDAVDLLDLGINMPFTIGSLDLPRLTPDFGGLRLTFPINAPRLGFGSLFPLKFRFFQFGDDRTGDLAALGYAKAAGTLAAFRFALGFDLDLGSLGKLAAKLKSLTFKVLFGWKPEGGFLLGFKAEGGGSGNLDIGLQGILRLLADHYRLDGAGEQIVIQLANCKLEVLGRRVPSDSTMNVFVFVPKGSGQIGWLASLQGRKGGDGAELEWIGAGQRVAVGIPPTARTIGTIIDHLSQTLGTIETPARLAALNASGAVRYDPGRDWTIGLRAGIYGSGGLDLLLRDPDLFGMRVWVGERTAPLSAVDISYRKITDELGVFAGELVPPPAWRQINVGAAAVTIPVIRVELYSDGGFLLDIGFPIDMDFSRSFTVEGGPFLGSGGLYLGRVSGAAGVVVPRRYYDPVLRVGFAMRIGLGRTFSKGALRAGLSVSVFGSLEGEFGFLMKDAPKLPDGGDAPGSYVYVLGRVGILGEVYGEVDLGIIKAAVSIRVWVALGVALETWQPVILSIEAGVSVNVEVVIGSFRIFGKTFAIRISLSYSERLSFSWKIGDDSNMHRLKPHPAAAGVPLMARAAARVKEEPTPLSWETGYVHDGGRRPLPLSFVTDVSIGEAGGGPVGIALLAVEGGAASTAAAGERPFDRLAAALAGWALWLHFGKAADALDREVDYDALTLLCDRLNAPKTLTRSGQGFAPLTYAVLRDFLTANFDVEVTTPAAGGGTTGAVYFPMIPDLVLEAGGAAADFAANPRPESYQDVVETWFEDLYHSARTPPPPLAAAAAGAEASVATMVFQDFFALLVKSVADELRDLLAKRERDAPERTPIKARDLIGRTMAEEKRWDALAARVSRALLSGVRLPDPSGAARATVPLQSATGQQFVFFPGGWPAAAPASYEVSLRAGAGGGWLRLSATPLPLDFARLDAFRRARPTVELVGPKLGALPPYQSRPRTFALAPPSALTGGGHLWPIGTDLRNTLRKARLERLELVFSELDGRGRATPVTTPIRPWATLIELKARPVRAAGGGILDHTCELTGSSEANRWYLDQLSKRPDLLDGASLSVLHETAPGVLEELHPAQAFILRTNLSAEARPDTDTLAAAAAEPSDAVDGPVAADIGAVRDFLELARRCSVVNSGGYWLYLRDAAGAGLASALFAGDAAAGGTRLTLAIRYKDAGHAHWLVSAVWDERPAQTPQPALDVLAPTLQVYAPARGPGLLAFRVHRRAPERSPDSEEAKALEQRFSVLSFGVRREDGTVLLGEDDSLPVAADAWPEPGDAVAPDDRPPAGVDPKDWRYTVTIPIHRVVGGGERYHAAVGDTFTVSASFRDVYGNRLDGATHAAPITHLYGDRLLPPGDWPGVTAVFRPDAGGFRVTLRWSPTPELAHDAEKQAVQFRRIHAQLVDANTTITLPCGLSGDGPAALTADEKGRLADFATLVLNAIADPATAAPIRHEMTVAVPRPTDEETARLTLSWRMSRPEALIGGRGPDGALPVPEVQDVVSPIRPDLGTGAGDAGLGAFAESFAAVFPGFRLAVGSDGDQDGVLWTVRERLLQAPFERGRIPHRPLRLALPPLSTALVSGRADIPLRNADGTVTGTAVEVREADLDVLLRDALREIEWVLEPARATSARALDATAVDELLAAKHALAGRLASRLLPVYQGEGDDAAEQPARRRAQETLIQRLRENLLGVYGIDGIVAVPLAPVSTGGLSPTLYGKLQDAGAADGFTVTASTVMLDQTPVLTLFVDALRELDQPTVTLPSPVYTVTHVERTGVAGGIDFRPANWLRLVVPVAQPLDAIEVPVVLRRHPGTPTLIQHEAGRAGPPAGAGLAEAVRAVRTWSYSVDFERLRDDQGGQDNLTVTVTYGARPAGDDRADTTPPTLPKLWLNALVGFARNHVAREAALRTLGGAAPAAELPQRLRDLAADAAMVAEAFAAAPAMALAGSADAADTFEVRDGAHGAGRRVTVAHVGGAGLATAFDILPLRTTGAAPVPGRSVDYQPGARAWLGWRLRVSGMDLMRAEAGWAGLGVVRNAGLGGPTRAPFIYRTPVVRFGDSQTPFLENLDAVEAALPSGAGTLLEHVHHLLYVLSDGAAHPLSVEMRIGFDSERISRHPVGAGVRHAPHPLLLLPGFRLDPGSAGVAQPAAEIAARLTAWYAASRPPPGVGSFVFDLRVYGVLSAIPRPILRLGDVRVRLSGVTGLP